MRELLFGGILYLAGVAIILVVRPPLLFNEKGQWKEFGIGRNPNTHTWMPFWLFCIFWALVSYSFIFIIIRLIEGRPITIQRGNNNGIANQPLPSMPLNQVQESVGADSKSNSRRSSRGLRRSMRVPPAGFGNMQPGYYVLNQNATSMNGVPHYVYYGPDTMRSGVVGGGLRMY
jgi:hypothetical protein